MFGVESKIDSRMLVPNGFPRKAARRAVIR
jgi:hypothetical protein